MPAQPASRTGGATTTGEPSARNADAGTPERNWPRRGSVFRIAGQLPGAARLLSLARVLPRPVVDRAYDAYARRRYRLFGKADRCLVVGPEYRDRFLDGSGAPAG